jgi:hypothetical protein
MDFLLSDDYPQDRGVNSHLVDRLGEELVHDR